jgi:hypothetical protein
MFFHQSKRELFTANLTSRSVGISHSYWEGAGLNYSRQGQDFSLLHSVQTGSGAHTPFYPVGIGVSYPGCKAVGA